MKRILLATIALVSISAIAQNRLDATSTKYYDQTNGMITSQDSVQHYYHSNGALQVITSVEPEFGWDTDVAIFSFSSPKPTSDSLRLFYGDPYVYNQTYIKDFTGSTLDTSTASINGVNNNRTIYQYDGNGNLVEALFQTYSGAVWNDANKTVYEYSGNNLTVTTEKDGLDVPYRIDSTWYNGADQVILKKNYDDDGAWYIESQTEMTYIGAEFDYGIIQQNQSGSAGTLDTVFAVQYYYTSSVLDSLEGFMYNSPSFDLVPFANLVFEYNGAGQLTAETSMFFGDTEKSEYDYNAAGLVTEHRNYDDGTTGTLELGEKTTLYYQDIAALAEKVKINLSLYPNPVANQLTIDTKEVVTGFQVTDMAGRIVLVQNSNQTTVGLGFLKAGNYLLTVNTNAGTATKQFIKQ